MRATELLRNKFGVSQLYKHEVKDGDDVVLEVYWHPLTIAERKKAQKAAKDDDPTEFALQLLTTKAKDENGGMLFTIADLPDLRIALPSSVVEALMLQLLDTSLEEEEEELDMKRA